MQGNLQMVLKTTLFGFPFNLIGSYSPGKSLLLVVDTGAPALKAEKAEGDQEAIGAFVKERLAQHPEDLEVLKEQLGASGDHALYALFQKISLHDSAIKRDLKKGITLFHIEVYIQLDLKDQASGMALRFIHLDLLLSSGEEDITKEAEDALRLEIAEAKSSLHGTLNQHQAVGNATRHLNSIEEALTKGNQFLEQMQDLEKVSREMADQFKQISNAGDALEDNQRLLKGFNQSISTSADKLTQANENLQTSLNTLAHYTEKIELNEALKSEALNKNLIEEKLKTMEQAGSYSPSKEELNELKKLASFEL